MDPLSRNNAKIERTYVPTSALAQSVQFDNEFMHAHLTGGRILSVPLIWFPLLRAATVEQREHYEIGAGGRGIYWPDLDKDISVAGLMGGVDWQAA